MSQPGRVREFLVGIVVDNLGLKIVSLFCAIGFFVFIRGSERAELRFDVGVIHTVPSEEARRTLVKEPPTNLSVTLRGPRAQLESLPRDLGSVTLDLSTGYESILEITRDKIPNVPPGVEVAQIFPSRIEVRWDDVVTRNLPIVVTRTGQLREGLGVSGAIATYPEFVRATGPRQIVDLMHDAGAVTFDLSDLGEGGFERTIQLVQPPLGVGYDVTSVRATVQIRREQKSVRFKAVRIEVVGAPKATTRPETVAVQVHGPSEVVAALDTDQLVPRVELPEDIDLSKPGSRMIGVVLEIPGAEVEVIPKEVLVKW